MGAHLGTGSIDLFLTGGHPQVLRHLFDGPCDPHDPWDAAHGISGVRAGDTVWWHCDLVPSVASVVDRQPPSSLEPVETSPFGRAAGRFPPVTTEPSHRPTPAHAREEAAARLTAYVYGNVIVLAALAVLDPRHAGSWHAILAVLGTGLATWVAHVFSALVGHGVRHGRPLAWKDVGHEVLTGRPIVTSAVLPAGVLALGLLGWLSDPTALAAACGVVAARMAFLGWVGARASGVRSPRQSVVAGVVFAGLTVLVAVVKVVLSH